MMAGPREMSRCLVSSLLCLILIGASFGYVDFRYHNYEELTRTLRLLNSKYPNITHLYSIGRSTQGRELWVIALGYPGTANRHRLLVPEVKYVGNIHGNEPVGKEMLLHFVDYLASQYNINRDVRNLLRKTRIHILPSMNPDGFERAFAGDCQGVRGRTNANGYDLNRNFPDYFDDVYIPRQRETHAVMSWLKEVPFVLSASYHGGALVTNYPYNNYWGGSPGQKYAQDSISPDDDVFRHISLLYASNHPKMTLGRPCPGDPEAFPHGIVNGAAWYPLTGGMQDYNYIVHGCFEVTLELSCCKYPLPGNLSRFWDLNRNPMLAFIKAAHAGVRGLVLDENSRPIKGATIKVYGREHDIKTTKDGEYWRLLLPGSYQIKVTKKGHNPSLQEIVVTSKTQYLRKDFILNKIKAPENSPVSLSANTPFASSILICFCILVNYYAFAS